MGLKLDLKKTLQARSDRVKSVDFHPSEPWLLVALYNGQVNIWNYEQQTLLKTFEICDLPSRCARFIARKSWFVVGSDDMHLRIFNYNTHERVTQFEAHQDYIRSVAVHPSQPLLLSCADDMLIKMWDWDKQWKCVMTFEGHTHYVMSVCFNPKDANTFASASLDKTVKVWQLGSSHANYTLDGHEKGVNCVEYYQGAEKPYLITAADDKNVKVWDYQNKTCVQTLEGHTQNVSAACFHPDLPIILSAGEDGTVRVWHQTTYRLENTLNYGFERVWSIGYQRGTNAVAFGYDEGTIAIQLGREDPAISMDSSGKVVYAKHNQIQSVNLQPADYASLKDGERVMSTVKDLGNSEVYPQTLEHSPNGRFAVVCGDGEYIIYTALSWRNKSFGQALEFVWSADSNEYAVRESSTKIKMFKQFKERVVLSTPFSAEQIFGGTLLAVRGGQFVCFYDWTTGSMVRRIDVVPKRIWWNESGEMVCIGCTDSYYILKFHFQVVQDALSSSGTLPEEGVESSFEVVNEISEQVKNGCWIGDCFIYTSQTNKLSYLVGGQVNIITHFDKPMYLLGYVAKDSKVLVCDKDMNVLTYTLALAVLEYQVAILRKDMTTAESLLPQLSNEQRNKVARFLDASDLKDLAMKVTTDQDHQFELALQLQLLQEAYQLAAAANNELKWKQVGDFALSQWQYAMAEDCLMRANDLSSMFLIHYCTGNIAGLEKIAQMSAEAGTFNLAFLSSLMSGDAQHCLDLLRSGQGKEQRLPEAALFSLTYLPGQLAKVASEWKTALEVEPGMRKIAQALADPLEHEKMFGDILKSHVQQARSPLKTVPPQPPQPPQRNNIADAESLSETMSGVSLEVNTTGTRSVQGQQQRQPSLSGSVTPAKGSTSPVKQPPQQTQQQLLDFDDFDAVLAATQPSSGQQQASSLTGDDELDDILNM